VTLGGAESALDRLRLGGTPVISVPVRALRAALADDRAGGYLRELERAYGTRDNLFDTKNALADHRFLFGRDAMLNTVGSALQRDEHVLITGLRKVGKTSLLNVLRQYLVDQPVCMVDLQRFDRHHEDWPSTLFRLMIEAFDRWGAAEHEVWPFRPSAPESVTELESELHRRIDHLGTSTRLVVVLDELERVFPQPDELEPTRRWVRASGALRALAQGDRRSVVLIGADLRPAVNQENRLGSVGTNPLFSFFQEMPLRLLDQAALMDMVGTLSREMGVDKLERDFASELFDLTGGHPSLARTLAAEAHRQRRDLDRMTTADLYSGLERLKDGGQIGYFLHNNLWQMMTISEREVVSGLTGIGHDRPVSPRWELDQARASLTAQGLVEADHIRISLLKRWLRDNPGVQ
jgi:energy-coupling factor transporter ATP-binding protein EcfA2